MGITPIAYRIWHLFKIKSGIIKFDFPYQYKIPSLIRLTEWRRNAPQFFFESGEQLKKTAFDLPEKKFLEERVQKIKEGYLTFFHGKEFFIGKDYDWLTNPQTGFRYDKNKHWSEIETLDPRAGDIKYVWEKSRFCYLYDLIRYDYHFKEDQAEFVFSEIISWIENNPVNRGPNFTCSQELSIRMLNWIFALYYYRNSEYLSEEIFIKILHSIYSQTRHVSSHINFSLYTVRNNHAITEALLLYTVGILFPFFNESNKWKGKGKKFLEQEGLYQIYEDGSYLQYSFNYQRIVLQLYTWAFYLAKANNERFTATLEKRVEKALDFLYEMQDEETGMLPNYGANDGALFFQLNSAHFRDFRPQLNALYYFLNERSLYKDPEIAEDCFWFTGSKTSPSFSSIKRKTSAFGIGGYYTLRERNTFSFIRCGKHKDRPSQADNLHLDIWVEGKNILRDAGSYKYNASPEEIKFFMGTASHNTVMLGGLDQMLKGGRFLWYYWTQAIEAEIIEMKDYQLFSGKIKAFHHSGNPVTHERTVKQFRKELKWEVEDIVKGARLPVRQIWNMNPDEASRIYFTCMDEYGKIIEGNNSSGWHSSTYGVKEDTPQVIFSADRDYLKTVIHYEEK